MLARQIAGVGLYGRILLCCSSGRAFLWEQLVPLLLVQPKAKHIS
jgi:hypothetical protein